MRELKSKIQPGLAYSSETRPWANYYADRMMSSSLVLAVASFEVAKISSGSTARKDPEAPSKRTFTRDPEFSQMWDSWQTFHFDRRGRAMYDGREAHAQFLASDADPAGKFFVASPLFQDYIAELTHDAGGPGPYFYRVLDAARTGDLEVIGALGNNLFSIARWDQAINWVDDRLESIKSTGRETPVNSKTQVDFSQNNSDYQVNWEERLTESRERFLGITNTLFSTLIDTKDQSKFRRFLLNHFPPIDVAVSDMSDPENYDPSPAWDRLQKLFESSSEANWRELADYILISQWYFFDKARVRSDQKILTGDFSGAKAIVALHRGLQPKEGGIITFYENESDAILHWSDQYAKGKITEDELANIPQGIKTIREAKSNYFSDQAFKDDSFRPIINDLLTDLRTSEVMLHQEVLTELSKLGIFPTPAIVKSFIELGSKQAIQSIEVLKTATAEGRFDPSNQVQRDLEFPSFVKASQEVYIPRINLDAFNNLFSSEPTQFLEGNLTPEQRSEADAASYEAALVYWFIRQRAEDKRRLVVVGNNRYGELFVTQPIEQELRDLNQGIKFYPARIPSTGTNSKTVKDVFSQGFIRTLTQDAPDVLIVDGTGYPSDEQGNSRFPTATLGYLNWFLALNQANGDFQPEQFQDHLAELQKNEGFNALVSEMSKRKIGVSYNISHWTPETITRNVVMGSMVVPGRAPGNDGPELIFINPVIANPVGYPGFPSLLTGHTPGAYDDPDKFEGKKEIGYSNFGVTVINNGLTEEAVILLAQEQMGRSFGRMKRLADPLNRDF